ncbi:MAG TPA: hypothetical protein VLL52_25865, partial [Anaerolineae bacterium]|nr:hypothetical protein [Anaerolineae bacterium]
MLKKFIEQIQQMAIASPAAERCGVIVDGEVIEFRNQDESPETNFIISARDLVGLHSNDFTIWHTHTPQGFHELTPADVAIAKFIKRPVLMVRGDGAWDLYDPLITKPYLGRTWRTYHRNCYSLMQDWYKQEWGVVLPDFYPNTPDEFTTISPSLFLKNLELYGFRQVAEPEKVGDVILTNEAHAQGWHCSIVTKTTPMIVCLSQWIQRP